ncbi:hypothetical protein H5368_10155 [Luteimonas sp. MC1782]|uniref:hypothetical protein n=1 Tax=Luteimonas sp. MC1782 TaxID=2760305 RepID=UPI00160296FC|nr:hypothetical protein [Luteimonas sp. MC1782]MBB1473397.1 hypothetical protein [Luteimonas sp. MC1782]
MSGGAHAGADVEDAGADRVYLYSTPRHTDGMDAVISSRRRTMRLGSDMVALRPCEAAGTVECLKSDYFNLQAPRAIDVPWWFDGEFGFTYLGKQRVSFGGATEVSVIASFQRQSMFLFYIDQDAGLIGWTHVSNSLGIPESYILEVKAQDAVD